MKADLRYGTVHCYSGEVEGHYKWYSVTVEVTNDDTIPGLRNYRNYSGTLFFHLHLLHSSIRGGWSTTENCDIILLFDGVMEALPDAGAVCLMMTILFIWLWNCSATDYSDGPLVLMTYLSGETPICSDYDVLIYWKYHLGAGGVTRRWVMRYSDYHWWWWCSGETDILLIHCVWQLKWNIVSHDTIRYWNSLMIWPIDIVWFGIVDDAWWWEYISDILLIGGDDTFWPVLTIPVTVHSTGIYYLPVLCPLFHWRLLTWWRYYGKRTLRWRLPPVLTGLVADSHCSLLLLHSVDGGVRLPCPVFYWCDAFVNSTCCWVMQLFLVIHFTWKYCYDMLLTIHLMIVVDLLGRWVLLSIVERKLLLFDTVHSDWYGAALLLYCWRAMMEVGGILMMMELKVLFCLFYDGLMQWWSDYIVDIDTDHYPFCYSLLEIHLTIDWSIHLLWRTIVMCWPIYSIDLEGGDLHCYPLLWWRYGGWPLSLRKLLFCSIEQVQFCDGAVRYGTITFTMFLIHLTATIYLPTTRWCGDAIDGSAFILTCGRHCGNICCCATLLRAWATDACRYSVMTAVIYRYLVVATTTGLFHFRLHLTYSILEMQYSDVLNYCCCWKWPLILVDGPDDITVIRVDTFTVRKLRRDDICIDILLLLIHSVTGIVLLLILVDGGIVMMLFYSVESITHSVVHYSACSLMKCLCFFYYCSILLMCEEEMTNLLFLSTWYLNVYRLCGEADILQCWEGRYRYLRDAGRAFRADEAGVAEMAVMQ